MKFPQTVRGLIKAVLSLTLSIKSLLFRFIKEDFKLEFVAKSNFFFGKSRKKIWFFLKYMLFHDKSKDFLNS